MNEDFRGPVNPRARSQNKARLASRLFSLFVISLAGGVSLGAQTDPAPIKGIIRTQSNGAPSGSSPLQDPKADWARAEKLAGATDPTRAYILGEVMVSNEAYVRAIPLLKDAIQRLSTGSEKESATYELYRAYILTNNWKAAADIWPSFHGGMRLEASSEALGDIAFAAARAQATDEAMRFWRAKTNLDRGDFNFLSDLAKLGLKERLRSFYQRLAKDDPESWAPKAALQLLH